MGSQNINIRVKTQAEKATSSLKGLGEGFNRLSKIGKDTSKSIGSVVNTLGGLSRVTQSLGPHMLGRLSASVVKTSMDIRESVHMFNVSMGDLAESTGATVDAMSELSGMDRIKMLDTVGEYNLLARSMGMTSSNAQVLSENTNKLALDLSALTNRDYIKVSEDLRSGLIGQAKTMYKYGVDVTEASIKQEALNQGLTKSVRHMSQSEKMGLRYAVMMKQTALSHGDFAKTSHSAANQMRILSDRFLTLSRTVGTMFIPTIEKVTPYLNAMVMALTEVAKAIAKIVGYSGEFEQAVNTPSDFGNMGVDDLSEDTDTATKSVKKLKSQLMGFDEINLYSEDMGQNPLDQISNADIGIGDFGLEGYENALDSMDNKTDKIFDNIMARFDEFRIAVQPTTDALKTLWDEGLSDLASFYWQNLKNFYGSFLKPVGEWTLGDDAGLPRFFRLMNEMLNNFNWDSVLESLDRLYKAMVPFAKFLATGAIDFFEYFLKPIAEWVFNVALERLADVLTRILEAVDWDKINEGLVEFWKALTKLALFGGEKILWLIENVLEPLAIWTIDTLGPKVLELLTEALDALLRVLKVLEPTWEWFWEDVIIPLGESIGVKLIDSIDDLIDTLDRLADWAEANPEKMNEMAKKAVKFGAAFLGLKPVAGVVTSLIKAFAMYKGGKSLYGLLGVDFSKLGQMGSDLTKGVASMPGPSAISSVVDMFAPSSGEESVINPFEHINLSTEIPPDVQADMDKLLLGVVPTESALSTMSEGMSKKVNDVIGDIVIDTEMDIAITNAMEEVEFGDTLDNIVGDAFKDVLYEDHFKKMTSGVPTVKADDVVEVGFLGKLKGMMGGFTKIFEISGVKIGLIVAGIALVAYAIYDNWDKIAELGKTLWENVLEPILSEIGEMVTFLWENVLQPVWEALKPAIKALADLVSDAFGRIIEVLQWLIPILADVFGPIIMTTIDIIKGVLGPALEMIGGLLVGGLGILEGLFDMIGGIINLDVEQFFNGFVKVLGGLWEMVKSVLSNAPGMVWNMFTAIGKIIVEWFELQRKWIFEILPGIGKEIWGKIVKWFKGLDLGKLVSDKFAEIKDSVKDFDFTFGISEKLSNINPFGKSKLTQRVGLKFAPLPKLAGGGLVDAGQMFIANEAGPEMVGKYGGKTGVVNNDQIVSAISEGVYKAVTSASMGGQSDGGGEAIMNVDGRELARVILPHLNREGKRQGYKPILEY